MNRSLSTFPILWIWNDLPWISKSNINEIPDTENRLDFNLNHFSLTFIVNLFNLAFNVWFWFVKYCQSTCINSLLHQRMSDRRELRQEKSIPDQFSDSKIRILNPVLSRGALFWLAAEIIFKWKGKKISNELLIINLSLTGMKNLHSKIRHTNYTA